MQHPALNETDSVRSRTRETSMRIRCSWLAAAGAAALVILAVPAAPVGAVQAGPAGSASAPRQLPVATGDPRPVGQPRLPRPCMIIRGALSTATGEFSSAQEAIPPDTSRIQRALDACAGTGRAVVLAAGGADNSFLSGPVTIRRHEVLL